MPPAAPNVSLRPVTPADDEFLLMVYGRSREAELNQVVWEEGQKEAFVAWQFKMQRQDYESRFADTEYAVVLADGEQVGRIWIARDEREIHLLDIAILPDFQNRGVGTILMKRLIDESHRTGKRLRHTVFMLNADAHRFYERLGFVDIEDAGAYKRMEYSGKVMSDE